MPKYSQRSHGRLDTVHIDLQIIFHEVIKGYDNTILYGRRTAAEQNELYKKGRRFDGENWVIENRSEVVTFRDGYFRRSNHQPPEGEVVGFAVDAVPYHQDYPHIRWKGRAAREAIVHFAGYVLGIASRLKAEGIIEHDIRWGGDWDSDRDLEEETFFDGAHFELVR